MTFIAPGGGRTVTNCTVYDRRKVYEMVATVVLDVVVSECNEVHKTGETTVREIVYHIVAPSEDLARAYFERRYGNKSQRHTLSSVEPLFCIDGEINSREN